MVDLLKSPRLPPPEKLGRSSARQARISTAEELNMIKEALSEEILQPAQKELPSIDFINSLKDPGDYYGGRFERSVSFNGEPYTVEMNTGSEKDAISGRIQFTVKKGENREIWQILQYNDALLLYFNSAKLPTFLVPGASVRINHTMHNPVAWLMYKEVSTGGCALTDADIDLEKSKVDPDYFDSAESAITSLTDLVDAIRSSQTNPAPSYPPIHQQ